MDIQTITAAHSIDRDLTRLAAFLSDEELRERVLAVQVNWRDVAYAISSTVCGVAVKNPKESGRKSGRGPGRPKKTEHADSGRMASGEDSLGTVDGITNDSGAQH
jgi:hypothetical protein